MSPVLYYLGLAINLIVISALIAGIGLLIGALLGDWLGRRRAPDAHTAREDLASARFLPPAWKTTAAGPFRAPAAERSRPRMNEETRCER